MNKEISKKELNRFRKFCSDHSLSIIGGVAALGIISTAAVFAMYKKDSDFAEFGRVALETAKEKGYVFYYYDGMPLDETIRKINESDKTITKDALEIMKALITDAKIVEPE